MMRQGCGEESCSGKEQGGPEKECEVIQCWLATKCRTKGGRGKRTKTSPRLGRLRLKHQWLKCWVQTRGLLTVGPTGRP